MLHDGATRPCLSLLVLVLPWGRLRSAALGGRDELGRAAGSSDRHSATGPGGTRSVRSSGRQPSPVSALARSLPCAACAPPSPPQNRKSNGLPSTAPGWLCRSRGAPSANSWLSVSVRLLAITAPPALFLRSAPHRRLALVDARCRSARFCCGVPSPPPPLPAACPELPPSRPADGS